MRLTVFRLLLLVAVSAILVHVTTDPLKTRSRERDERCRQLGDSHARIATECRRNSEGDAGMLRIAEWHEHMRNELERAARDPDGPFPRSHPFPPKSWIAPAAVDAATR